MSLPIPPLRSPGHDDGTMDAIALTEAVLRDDMEGAGAIVRSCDPADVAVSAIKLLAELYRDTLELVEYRTGIPQQDVSPAAFRSWALRAVRRA